MELSESSSSSSTLGLGESLGRAGGGPAGGYASGAEGSPPVSNTGGKLTVGGVGVAAVKVDWFAGTLPLVMLPDVVSKLSEVMGESEEVDRGRNFYKSSVRWATGAVVGFNEEGSAATRWKDGTDTCCVELSASVIDYMTPVQQLAFIRWFVAVGGRCSRVDVALDVFDRSMLRMEDVHAAADAGNFAGFKRESAVIERVAGVLSGDSHTFGDRGKNGSGRLVQFYDKKLESDGQIDAVRMEARYSKKYARVVCQMLALAEDLDGFTLQMRAVLGDAIDFIDRGENGEEHLTRCAPLAWWAEVQKLLGSASIVVRKVVPPLEESLVWRKENQAMGLALMWEIADSQGLDGEAVLIEYMRQSVRMGKAKLDAGKKPGTKRLGLDFTRLLCA